MNFKNRIAQKASLRETQFRVADSAMSERTAEHASSLPVDLSQEVCWGDGIIYTINFTDLIGKQTQSFIGLRKVGDATTEGNFFKWDALRGT